MTDVVSAIQAEHGRRQRERILAFIEQHQAEHGWAPSVREIGAAVGGTVSATHRHLQRMHRDGQLVLGGGARMIRLNSGRIDLR